MADLRQQWVGFWREERSEMWEEVMTAEEWWRDVHDTSWRWPFSHSTRSLDCFGYCSLFVPTNLCSHQNREDNHTKSASTELGSDMIGHCLTTFYNTNWQQDYQTHTKCETFALHSTTIASAFQKKNFLHACKPVAQCRGFRTCVHLICSCFDSCLPGSLSCYRIHALHQQVTSVLSWSKVILAQTSSCYVMFSTKQNSIANCLPR